MMMVNVRTTPKAFLTDTGFLHTNSFVVRVNRRQHLDINCSLYFRLKWFTNISKRSWRNAKCEKIRIYREIPLRVILDSHHSNRALFPYFFLFFSTWKHAYFETSDVSSDSTPYGVTDSLPHNVAQYFLERTLCNSGWWIHSIYKCVNAVVIPRQLTSIDPKPSWYC